MNTYVWHINRHDNLMRFSKCILLFSAFYLSSCIKKELTVPEEEQLITTPIKNGIEFTEINGYFFAGLRIYDKITENYNSGFFFCYFNDPADRLLLNCDRRDFNMENNTLANVNVGQVGFSGVEVWKIEETNNFFYRSYSGFFRLPDPPVWQTEGNATFSSITQRVERKFPQVKISDTIQSINPLKGITFRFKDKFENCDSVGIQLFYYPGKVYKVAWRYSDSITFSPAELKFMKHLNFVSVYFWASNFSSQTVNNKKYVYELMIREETTLKVDTLF